MSALPFKTLILHFGYIVRMLSVLIPTYNFDITHLVSQLHRQLVAGAIDFEIIVADDASPNSQITANNAAVSSFSNTFFMAHPTNQGRTATRNFLAEKAKYKRLLFLDADVMPKNEDFIAKFLSHTDADLVFGGIRYADEKPDKNQMLRWKYGRAREAKSVPQRLKYPYLSVISGCVFIKKEIFFKTNEIFENRYGLDVLFCQNLEKMQAVVKHIDNPVIHLGLETNRAFVEKTKKGIESLVYFEQQGTIPHNYRPLQKAYLKLKKYRLSGVFRRLAGVGRPLIERNLLSSRPSLFLFDVYKLHYFVKLKQPVNA